MEKLKEIFLKADRKKLTNLSVGLIVGIALLVFSNSFLKSERPKANVTVTADSLTDNPDRDAQLDTYEKNLEQRLESALGLVEGVGKVKAMVTLSYSKELVLSQDTVIDESTTKEMDKEGGTREITNKKSDVKNIIITQNGQQQPLILKELEPKVEGVIIVAEGGNVAEVQKALIEAVQTVLALEPHKIQILKMKQ